MSWQQCQWWNSRQEWKQYTLASYGIKVSQQKDTAFCYTRKQRKMFPKQYTVYLASTLRSKLAPSLPTYDSIRNFKWKFPSTFQACEIYFI